MIEAIIPCKEQRVYTQGKYPIQLDIPEGSTLTTGEVDRLARLASWQTVPIRENVEGYEGGRSVLLRREYSPWRHGVQLRGLQISGIGYQDIDVAGEVGFYDTSRPFHPPSQTNFIERVGRYMRTTHAENGRFVHTRPTYRALGTYLADELKLKVEKTHEAGNLILDRIITPSVEAYGHYLNLDFSYDGKPFGFLAISLPKLQCERSSGEIQDSLIHAVAGLQDPSLIIKNWVDIFIPFVEPCIKGLRELHDNARRAHLQPHLSNFYLLGEKIYLCDWPTMVYLDGNRSNNLLNRTIDLVKPIDNGAQLLAAYLTRDHEKQANLRERLLMPFRERGMDIYAGLPKGSIRYADLFLPLIYDRLPSTLDDTSIIAGWMSKQGFEGYTERARANSSLADHVRELWNIPYSSDFISSSIVDASRRNAKIGRNESCTCGSGKKYKKCCGK